MVLAVLFAIVMSSNFFKISNNFILNPAVAIMYQIFPTSAENFGTLISKVGLEILVFILAPIVASVLAFFIGDIATTLAGEDECENHHHGKDCPCHEK